MVLGLVPEGAMLCLEGWIPLESMRNETFSISSHVYEAFARRSSRGYYSISGLEGNCHLA